ncbi:hypothetical protein D3C85_1016830 [compost metagenome]
MPQPTHRFTDHTKSGTIAVWPGLAVTRDPEHDEFWIQGVQCVPAQPPAFQGPRAKILYQHIRVGQQLAHDLLGFTLAQIEGQRAFVARLCGPPDGSTVVQQAPFAQWVTSDRRLDLDHVGAKFTEHFRRKWPGNQLTELHDLDTLQR